MRCDSFEMESLLGCIHENIEIRIRMNSRGSLQDLIQYFIDTRTCVPTYEELLKYSGVTHYSFVPMTSESQWYQYPVETKNRFAAQEILDMHPP